MGGSWAAGSRTGSLEMPDTSLGLLSISKSVDDATLPASTPWMPRSWTAPIRQVSLPDTRPASHHVRHQGHVHRQHQWSTSFFKFSRTCKARFGRPAVGSAFQGRHYHTINSEGVGLVVFQSSISSDQWIFDSLQPPNSPSRGPPNISQRT